MYRSLEIKKKKEIHQLLENMKRVLSFFLRWKDENTRNSSTAM